MKRQFEKAILGLLACVTLTSHARGDEIPSDWKSARALGMGNSATAVANDETAPFTNPAGIARQRNPLSKHILHYLSVPGISVLANTSALSGLRSGSGYVKGRINGLLDHIKNDPNASVYFETQAYPAAIVGARRSAAYLIGTPIRSVTKISVPDPANPTIASISSVNTATALVAMGGSSTRGGVNYGLAARPNYRYSLIDNAYDLSSVDYTTLMKDIKAKATKTSAIAIDAGFMVTVPDYWLPTFGIAIHNIPLGCIKDYVNPVTGDTQTMCGTLRTGASGSTNNEDRIDPTSVAAGFSITPRMRIGATRINLRISADAYPLPIKISKQSYGVDNIYLNKILHAGADLSFGHALMDNGFSLRAGYSQGYLTYGASIDFYGVSIDYASYAEDIGAKKESKEDRRHLIGISSHW